MIKQIGLAAIAGVFLASPALSANRDNPFTAESAVLSLRGLDLATVDGQRRLAIRMDQAANAVCGEGMSKIHLALAEQARACRADVIADIRTRIAAASAAQEPATGKQFAGR